MKLARRGPGAWALAAVLLVPAPLPRLADGSDLLFEPLAQRWLERNEARPDHPGGWPALLEERFAHLGLGLFELRVPAPALSEGQNARHVARAAQALLEAQAGWLAWTRGETQVRPEKAPKDDAVGRWLAGWNAKTFAGKPLAGIDLLEAGAAPPEVRERLARLREELRAGPALGFERPLPGVRLALFPRRAEFVEFVCVAGLLDSHLTASAFDQGLSTWLEYTAQDTRFLTLEFGSDAAGNTLARGEGLAERNPLALSELVAQVGTRAMLLQLYGGRLDPALASGMANALVIELYGELDTRIDGDVRSRSSEGTSVFVPGGNPDGGILPATSAENRWRGTKGRDHFVGILAQVQKQGGKKAPTRPERLTRFELMADDGSRKAPVSAPFLGQEAKKPAPDLLADYLELVRCYGVAFLHWLRVSGAGEPEASAARFGEFLLALARDGASAELPRLLQEHYGRPLSASSPDGMFAEETLEGAFLAWLAKGG